jgi:hypothetical protein
VNIPIQLCIFLVMNTLHLQSFYSGLITLIIFNFISLCCLIFGSRQKIEFSYRYRPWNRYYLSLVLFLSFFIKSNDYLVGSESPFYLIKFETLLFLLSSMLTIITINYSDDYNTFKLESSWKLLPFLNKTMLQSISWTTRDVIKVSFHFLIVLSIMLFLSGRIHTSQLHLYLYLYKIILQTTIYILYFKFAQKTFDYFLFHPMEFLDSSLVISLASNSAIKYDSYRDIASILSNSTKSKWQTLMDISEKKIKLIIQEANSLDSSSQYHAILPCFRIQSMSHQMNTIFNILSFYELRNISKTFNSRKKHITDESSWYNIIFLLSFRLNTFSVQVIMHCIIFHTVAN